MKQLNLKTTLAVSIIAALSGCSGLSSDSATDSASATPLPLSVTASDHDGNTPEQTLDGDIKTRWSASGVGASMTFDYGEPVRFDAVKIAFHKGDARSTKFDIEVSQDGKTWTKVIDQAASAGSSLDPEQFDFEPVDARFVKYVGHGNTSNKWNSVTEFKAINCAVDECAKTLRPVAATASDHDGNGPERLFDNNLKTRWSAQGDGAWAVLDYGEVSEINAVRLAFHKGDQRSTMFDIEVSEDGNTWKPVVTNGESTGIQTGYERFEFEPVNARYIRYVGHGNSKSNWNSVTELAALDCATAECPSEHLMTPERIAALKLEIDAKKRNIKHVGKTTTLDDWKITLPTTYAEFFGEKANNPEYFGGQAADLAGAAEVLPNKCSVDGSSLNDLKDEYFWVDNKGWHFRTPLEGGATTPNATYIRTELRELANGWQPCDETPMANWEWGGEHTLTAELTLDEIPAAPLKKDGKSKERPKVVLGQIHAHDISAATVKLLWEGEDKPIRVILNKDTTKSAFSVKLGMIKDPSKPWSYQIKMHQHGIDLSAGGVTKKLEFGKDLSDDWKKETFYFKAGLYPQVYKESGGAFEATFSKLSIKHTERPGNFGTPVPLVATADGKPIDCDAHSSECVWWDAPLPKPALSAKPVAGKKPGENFDLTGWYLSLPFDHDKNGKPDDVFEGSLANGYEHPEMFYTADDGGLVFKSFIKGVRTSKNTKYVRTELREMLRSQSYGDLNAELKGVTKNNWVFSSAPVEDQKAAAGVDGVFEATLKIDHTTTTGKPEQIGRVIIGQIHDKDDEPIRLYYRKLPDQEKGTVYFAHENSIEGSDNYFELAGGQSGISDDGVALGEVFSYRIEVVGNDMTVTLMRDGKPDVVQVVDMSKSGYDQGGRYMYFKAGVYNQNNSGDPDDYVQATFYKLDKSHSQYQG